MDGSNRTLIVSQVKKFPNDITLDYKERLIFWVDSESSVIECADFLGGNRRTIASALSKPFALTQFEDYVYWTDWDTESIERANKTTGLNRTRIRSGVDFVMDIVVFHTTRQEGEFPGILHFHIDHNDRDDLGTNLSGNKARQSRDSKRWAGILSPTEAQEISFSFSAFSYSMIS